MFQFLYIPYHEPKGRLFENSVFFGYTFNTENEPTKSRLTTSADLYGFHVQ